MNTNITNRNVAKKLNTYPSNVRNKLLKLRQIILEIAFTTQGVGALEETLRWGQISYLTTETNLGSVVRIDSIKPEHKKYALYFHCQTNLVATLKKLFPYTFTYEKNRAIIFDLNDIIPLQELKKCLKLALTYHHNKKK